MTNFLPWIYCRAAGKKCGFASSVDVTKLTSTEMKLSGMTDFEHDNGGSQSDGDNSGAQDDGASGDSDEQLDVNDLPSDVEITEDNIMS